MGGVLIFAVVAASALFWCKLSTTFTIIPLVCGLGFGAVGFADDLLKIRGKSSEAGVSRSVKYAGQILMALLLAALFFSAASSPIADSTVRWSLYAPLVTSGVSLGYAYVAVVIVFMVAAANSVNLTDGMDGLAAVPVIFLALVLGAFGYVTGHAVFAEYLNFFPVADSGGQVAYGLPDAGELMVVAAAIAGAAVGFLWYNAHPAALFMGDTGSMALGGMLGSMAVIGKQEAIFFIAGGLFVLECASSFIQDYIGIKLLGRRILFRAPLHHNLLHNGTAETKVTVRLWILSGFFAVLALCTLKMR
jgi:phospho-N-acetylmuramoyl-pentapeptide-transferase